MDALKIIGLSIVAAILDGVVHDQVTARVCVEYFTIGHPPVFATESPNLLGIGWGIIATWWVGALLGVPLAFAATRGRRGSAMSSCMMGAGLSRSTSTDRIRGDFSPQLTTSTPIPPDSRI